MQRDRTKIGAAPFSLSWPALIGGAAAAAGVWLILHVFGLALGVSRLEPGDVSDLRAAGVGGGLWVVLTSALSMLGGGMVTARAAGILGRSNAALHGVVLWATTSLLGLVLLVTLVASLARGAAGVTSVEVLTADGSIATLQSDGSGRWMRSPPAPEARAEQQARAEERVGTGRQVAAASLWTLFASMVVSLACSVVGTLVGITSAQRELSDQVQREMRLSYGASGPSEAAL